MLMMNTLIDFVVLAALLPFLLCLARLAYGGAQ
jgi:hypothetical protein